MYYILPPSPSALERYRLFKDCIWLSVFLFFLSFLRRVCIYPSLSLDAARRAAAVPYVFHSGFLSATRQPRFLRVPTRVLFGRPGSCGGTLPSSFHLWTVVSPDLHRRPAIRRHGPTSCRGAAIHRQLLARTSKMLAHRNPSVFALNLSSASGESTNRPARDKIFVPRGDNNGVSLARAKWSHPSSASIALREGGRSIYLRGDLVERRARPARRSPPRRL